MNFLFKLKSLFDLKFDIWILNEYFNSEIWILEVWIIILKS